MVSFKTRDYISILEFGEPMQDIPKLKGGRRICYRKFLKK